MSRRSHNRTDKSSEREIVRYYQQHLPAFSEVGRQLGVPASTVRDVLHRHARERSTTLEELRRGWRRVIRRRVWAEAGVRMPPGLDRA